MNNIKNIIFDLGVVLYDLDQTATHTALAQLGITHPTEIFTLKEQNHLCHQFETGEIDETTFFKNLQQLTTMPVSEKQLKTAWQAMLIGLPLEKFLLLNELRKNYTLMVLSNTNSAHIETVNEFLLTHYHISSIQQLFDYTYLSFEMGLRKPDVAIFHYVIEHTHINPRDTLFIDDQNENVIAAQSTGLQGVVYKKGGDLKAVLQIP